MLAAGIPTLFQARRFYTEVLAKWARRAILWVLGIRFVVHQTAPFLPRRPSISRITPLLSMSSFSSRWVFARTILSQRFLRKIVPLAIIGYSLVFGPYLRIRRIDKDFPTGGENPASNGRLRLFESEGVNLAERSALSTRRRLIPIWTCQSFRCLFRSPAINPRKATILSREQCMSM